MSYSVHGNAAFNESNGYKGPYRVGVFEISSESLERPKSGAGFYGVMELSGNLWERAVSIGLAVGRKFTGSHGDGTLISDTGEANVENWPGIDSKGAGFRGGGWRSGSSVLRVSDRVGAEDVRGGRSSALGFRAVRSAP